VQVQVRGEEQEQVLELVSEPVQEGSWGEEQLVAEYPLLPLQQVRAEQSGYRRRD
jgi:hypothetical protein